MFSDFKIKLILLIFLFLGIFFPNSSKALTCNTNVDGKNDAELQAILDQCDREIAEQKKILEGTQKQSSEFRLFQ